MASVPATPPPTTLQPAHRIRMTERRYSDDEVSEILDRATEATSAGRGPSLTSSQGTSLSELHEIADEVGIPKELITRAAASLERGTDDPVARRKWLGQNIGVGRTVDLPRALTDAEWNRLVVDLRETFNAKGKIQSEGAFRQWTNSNLQALLEPTENGQRLRLRTFKGNAIQFQGMGLGFAVLPAIIALFSSPASVDIRSTVVLASMGIAAFLGSRLTVPIWARTRAEQMEGVVARLKASMSDEE